MTSVYNAVFLAIFLGAVGLVLLARAGFGLARLRALGAAAAVAAVLSAPVAQAHLKARAVVGERHPDEAARNSARLSDYLAAPSGHPLHRHWAADSGGHERRL